MYGESGYRRFVSEKEIANGIVDVKRKSLSTYFELHWHDFFEITYYYEGRGKNIINGKEYDITPGCAIFLTPTDYHEITAEEEMKEITLMINPDVIPDEIVNDTVPNDDAVWYIFEGEERTRIEMLLGMLLEEFNGSSEYNLVCQRNLVRLITSLTVRGYRKMTSGESHTEKRQSDRNDRIFKRAMSYILMNFTRNPGLSEIAEYLGYSPCYFSRYFHEMCGVSYKEYVRKLRLNHAKRLLLSADMSVAEVSRSSGYGTLQVFLADFKKAFGETPTAFKRRYINKKNSEFE